jgi:hypothetical protein
VVSALTSSAAATPIPGSASSDLAAALRRVEERLDRIERAVARD